MKTFCIIMVFLLQTPAFSYEWRRLGVGEGKWLFSYLVTCNDGTQFSQSEPCGSAFGGRACAAGCANHGGSVNRGNQDPVVKRVQGPTNNH